MSAVELTTVGAFAQQALGEFLVTMLEIEDGEATEPSLTDDPMPNSELTAFVGFAGDLKGGVTIQGTLLAGRLVAAGLLCVDDPEELEHDEIQDAFGEVANIIAGGIKTRLEDDGFATDISVPVTVLSPEKISLHYKPVSPVVWLEAKCQGELIRVAVSMASAK